MIRLPREIVDEMIAHAQSEAPQTACGAVAGRGEFVRRIYPFRNTSDNPSSKFDLDTEELFEANQDADTLGLSLLGIYYSDPQGNQKPPREIIEDWYSPYVCLAVSFHLGKRANLAGGKSIGASLPQSTWKYRESRAER